MEGRVERPGVGWQHPGMSTKTSVADPDLPLGRRVVVRWILAGNLVAALTFATLYALWPSVVLAAPVDRLLFAVELGAIPGAVLVLVLQSLWRIADTDGAESPLAGRESRRWKINQRVMSNTLEQSAMFVPGLSALAVAIDAAHTRVLPILVCTWTIGRLLFWAGYHVRPHVRAFGMDTTFLAVAVTYGWLAYRVFVA